MQRHRPPPRDDEFGDELDPPMGRRDLLRFAATVLAVWLALLAALHLIKP